MDIIYYSNYIISIFIFYCDIIYIMGGNTGNIRTLRNQSGTVGERTLGSIIASDSGNGAGSIARLAKWYASRAPTNGTPGFFVNVLGIKRGSLSRFNTYNNLNLSV
jgi:hypothetical protein